MEKLFKFFEIAAMLLVTISVVVMIAVSVINGWHTEFTAIMCIVFIFCCLSINVMINER